MQDCGASCSCSFWFRWKRSRNCFSLYLYRILHTACFYPDASAVNHFTKPPFNNLSIIYSGEEKSKHDLLAVSVCSCFWRYKLSSKWIRSLSCFSFGFTLAHVDTPVCMICFVGFNWGKGVLKAFNRNLAFLWIRILIPVISPLLCSLMFTQEWIINTW